MNELGAGPAEVVIVKVRRNDYEEEHRSHGLWKIAYADFVTALMAFFLVMWLVNATTKEQRDGISSYFNPVAVATGASGTDGLLAGRTTDSEGVLDSPNGAARTARPITSPPVIAALGRAEEVPKGTMRSHLAGPNDLDKIASVPPMAVTARDALEVPEKTGVQVFDDPFAPLSPAAHSPDIVSFVEKPTVTAKVAEGPADSNNLMHDSPVDQKHKPEALGELLEKLSTLVEKQGLSENLELNVDSDGLRIQISDNAKVSMFPVGSLEPEPALSKILSAVSEVLQSIPNGIMITGHTDSRPYRGLKGYTNWELSTDRANAARRILLDGGLEPERIFRVEGYGDRRPVIPSDPMDPRNRRITILVLAKSPLPITP